MNSAMVKLESSRARWWQIYCKCRQILSGNTASLTDIQDLSDACEIARQTTTDLLCRYLHGIQGEYEGEESLQEKESRSELRITSVWLWAFLGHRLIGSETFRRYQDGQEAEERFTRQEQLEFYHRSSTFFLYLLQEVKADIATRSRGIQSLEALDGIGYLQVGRSLMYLLSEYCHLDIGIPRLLDVETALREAILSDAYLYLTMEQYRDHVFHVVDVCLLGLFLLDCRLSEGKDIGTLFSELIHGTPDARNSVVQNWFVAALFHDIGYSLQIRERRWEELVRGTEDQEYSASQQERRIRLDELNVRRRNLAELRLRKAKYGVSFPIHLIYAIEAEQEEVDRLEAELRHRHTSTDGDRMEQPHRTSDDASGAADQTDHGERSYDYVKDVLLARGNEPPSSSSGFDPALEAIRKHNLMEKKVVFSEEPLSFLLILCDELQEWGRARVDPLELREQLVSKVAFPDASILPTNRLLNHLTLNVRWDTGDTFGIIPDRSLSFCLTYRDATEEQFEPLAVWLLKSHNLQRVHLADDDLKITVTMCNPICGDLNGIQSSDVCEFSILRDYMRDVRRWRELQSWIENNDAVQWTIEKEHSGAQAVPMERVTLCINKLADADLLHDDPREILDELLGWRREYIRGRRRKL